LLSVYPNPNCNPNPNRNPNYNPDRNRNLDHNPNPMALSYHFVDGKLLPLFIIKENLE